MKLCLFSKYVILRVFFLIFISFLNISEHADILKGNLTQRLADDSPRSKSAATCPLIYLFPVAASALLWQSPIGTELNSCDRLCRSSFTGMRLV